MRRKRLICHRDPAGGVRLQPDPSISPQHPAHLVERPRGSAQPPASATPASPPAGPTARCRAPWPSAHPSRSAIVAPRSRARRASASFKSSRSGLAVDLERDACRAAAALTIWSTLTRQRARAGAAAGRSGGPARPPSGSRAPAARGRSSAIRPARSASGPTPPRCRARARQSSARSSRAVGEDVALDAGEQRQPFEAAVQRPHARGVLERAPLVEAVGHRQRLAVVGDGDVARSRAGARRRPSTSSVSRPSLAVVCMCRSPRRSARVTSERAAAPPRSRSSSPRCSRSSGSTQRSPSAL